MRTRTATSGSKRSAALSRVWTPLSQETIRRSGEPNIPVASSLDSLSEAPEDVLKAFVDGLKEGPIYAFAKGLASEKVEPEVARWSQELGVPLQAQSVGFLKFILQDLKPAIPYNGSNLAWVAMVPVEIGVGRRFEVPGLVVQIDRKTLETYRLPPGKLGDLDFRFVRSISILHPLNKVLDRYALERRPLTDVVAELCQKAGVDFANRNEAAGEVVTLQLTKKKIIDCLRLAASVGGMRIREEPPNTMDGTVSFESAFPLWSMRQFLNESEKPQPPLEAPLDVLRYLVAKRAAEMKEDVPVILLLPKETEKK